ncbi:hypothetical protein T06_10053 [Trichinella sp. T6]|nr:hypothetical protein T06_10053 [Trichinella sp. T6]
MSSEDFSSTAFELDLNRNVNFHRCPALNTLPKNGDKTSSERHLNRRPLATSIGAARQLLSTLQRFRINETMHIYTYADLRSQAGHAVYDFENKNKYKFSTKPSFPRQISTIPRFNYCNLQKATAVEQLFIVARKGQRKSTVEQLQDEAIRPRPAGLNNAVDAKKPSRRRRRNANAEANQHHHTRSGQTGSSSRLFPPSAYTTT